MPEPNQKTPKDLHVVSYTFDSKTTAYLLVNYRGNSVVETMTLKKLQLNRYLLVVLSTSKPCLRKVNLYNVNREFIKLTSELCLNSAGSNVEFPDVTR